MMAKYNTERDGQLAFFDNFDIDYEHEPVLLDRTDGVYHGNLFEFKLSIGNLGAVLMQAVKYCSGLRIVGASVPARIMLVDLNKTTAYVFKTEDYRAEVQRTYIGAASRDNKAAGLSVSPIGTYDWTDMGQAAELKRLIVNKSESWYMPIDIDEDCIVGWASRYYTEIPNATKGDFLGDGTGKINVTGEIRDPRHFKGLIKPYRKATNERFKYLMDCLNDRRSRRDLGAFYTPEQYAELAAGLVEKAVARVPDGDDYIILDRCAGTGNLEAALGDKRDKHGDLLLSHCVVSTYEYYEYKVLLERLGQDVRDIIPPTEANVVYENGKVSNADALSKEYLDNPILRRYVDDPHCVIILLENPPYRDATTSDTRTIADSFVRKEMEKVHGGAVLNDLSNLFIWSGFRYFQRRAYDSYIVFSPVKYFTRYQLANRVLVDGYLLNRKHFHATESGIALMCWSNVVDNDTVCWWLPCMDIVGDKVIHDGCVNFRVTKSFTSFSDRLYDNRVFDSDVNGICCELSGVERTGSRCIEPKYNDNIIGYMVVHGNSFAPMHKQLLRCAEYDGHGFYLRSDNFMHKLPLWAAKQWPFEYWWEKDVLATTSDGGVEYTRDDAFLQRCLLYTALSRANKCLSFTGSDGRFYRNELCLDTHNGPTLVSDSFHRGQYDTPERRAVDQLLDLWRQLLEQARTTANWNDALTYGVYQIDRELNTRHKEGTGSKEHVVYDYPVLNGLLEALRIKLKEYYTGWIKDNMLHYQLVK